MTTAVGESDEPLLLRPAEAARLLGVSRAKVYELIAQDKLPGVVHATGSIRISRSALERWIAAGCESFTPGTIPKAVL